MGKKKVNPGYFYEKNVISNALLLFYKSDTRGNVNQISPLKYGYEEEKETWDWNLKSSENNE